MVTTTHFSTNSGARLWVWEVIQRGTLGMNFLPQERSSMPFKVLSRRVIPSLTKVIVTLTWYDVGFVYLWEFFSKTHFQAWQIPQCYYWSFYIVNMKLRDRHHLRSNLSLERFQAIPLRVVRSATMQGVFHTSSRSYVRWHATPPFTATFPDVDRRWTWQGWVWRHCGTSNQETTV